MKVKSIIAVGAILLLFSQFCGLNSNETKTSLKGPELALFLPWGSGEWEAGRTMVEEGVSTAPRSFAISAAGEIYVLDRDNSRVLKFQKNGSPASQFSLQYGAYEDIEVAQDGKLIILDRFRRQSIIILEENGIEKANYGIVGRGIKQVGGVGLMVLCKNGLYLDYSWNSDSYLVHLLDGSLQPVERKIIPGNTLFRDCKKTVDVRLPRGRDEAVLRINDVKTGGKLKEKVISLEGKENCSFYCLEVDRYNQIHLILYSFKEIVTNADKHLPNEIYTFLTLDKNLKEIREITFPPPEDGIYLGDDPFRSFRVVSTGEIYFMTYTEKGLKILRWK
jgi:hypothetical protein